MSSHRGGGTDRSRRPRRMDAGSGLLALMLAAVTAPAWGLWDTGLTEPGGDSATVGTHDHATCPACAAGHSHSHHHHGHSHHDYGDTVGFADFQILTRWSQTAQQPRGSTLGNPTQLTWGFAQEGSTIISTRESEETGPSSLIEFLDGIRDPASTGGADLTQRAWFGIFEQAFGRIDELSGVSYTYEPNDDGIDISGRVNSGTLGQVGVRPDVRIGGHLIDGQSNPNVIAYNYFPSAGDMVLDTGNVSTFSSTFLDNLQFRQVIMHEALHGLGLQHVESNNSRQLMEPFLDISFDGPQFDDILALHRNYGDAYEEDGGNDNAFTATEFGVLRAGDAVAVGTDARSTSAVVTPDMTDFISISGINDEDWFSFTITEPAATITATLTPKGPTYNQGPQGGEQAPLVTDALNDLRLELIDDPLDFFFNETALAVADDTIAGGSEILANLVLDPGEYFLRVTGSIDDVQMYRLDLTFIPEPATIATLLASTVLLRRRRRRL
ncbi:MAG: matrixin family metalloprotease [Planctomycetota bacterium]